MKISFDKKQRFGDIFTEAPSPSCEKDECHTTGALANDDPVKVETDLFVLRTQKVVDDFS